MSVLYKQFYVLVLSGILYALSFGHLHVQWLYNVCKLCNIVHKIVSYDE